VRRWCKEGLELDGDGNIEQERKRKKAYAPVWNRWRQDVVRQKRCAAFLVVVAC